MKRTIIITVFWLKIFVIFVAGSWWKKRNQAPNNWQLACTKWKVLNLFSKASVNERLLFFALLFFKSQNTKPRLFTGKQVNREIPVCFVVWSTYFVWFFGHLGAAETTCKDTYSTKTLSSWFSKFKHTYIDSELRPWPQDEHNILALFMVSSNIWTKLWSVVTS